MPQQEPSEKELYEKFKARKSKRPTPPVGAEKQSQMYDPEFDIGGMPTASPAPKLDWMAMPESKPMVGAPVGSDAVMSKRRAIADMVRGFMPRNEEFGYKQRDEKLRQVVERPEMASEILSDEDLLGLAEKDYPVPGETKYYGQRPYTDDSLPLEKIPVVGGLFEKGSAERPEVSRRRQLEALVLELRKAMEADKGKTLPVGAATPADVEMKEGEIAGLRGQEKAAMEVPTAGPLGESNKQKNLAGIRESIEAVIGGLGKGLAATKRSGEIPGKPVPEAPPVPPTKEQLPKPEQPAGIVDKSESPQNASMLQDINKMFPEIQARDPGILEGIIAVLGGFLSGKPQTESIDRLLGKPEAAARNKQRSELFKSMIQQQGRAQSQDQSSRDRAMRIAIAQYGVEAKPILTKLFSITDEQEGLEASLMPPDRKSERRRVLEAQEAAIYKTLAEMQGKYGVVK